MPKGIIYLDNNATTPLDPRALEAMLPYFGEKFGNAASNTHAFGWEAAEAVKIAREKVASLINATPEEIIFTSGATESINLALKGVAESYRSKGNHIITLSTEHKAVLDTCRYSERSEESLHITYLPVDPKGIVDLEEFINSFSDKTILVCVMLANNETGLIQNITALSKITHDKGALFMSDCTQAAGKISIDIHALGIDLAAISAHKMYGPKGVGALFIRRKNPRVALSPIIHGGGHERGFRSGTLNVPSIVGFGEAASIASQEMQADFQRVKSFRDHLEEELTNSFSFISINGEKINRLPNTSNLLIKGIPSKDLMSKLPGLAFSSGSACTSALAQPSHVLDAMGLSEEDSYGSIRISLGRFTTKEEVGIAIERLIGAIGG